MNYKNNKRLPTQYRNFKEQLLMAMIQLDPLGILESGIFQRYQENIINSNTVIRDSLNIQNFQSKIASYEIDTPLYNQDGHIKQNRSTFRYQMVERRSKSVQKQVMYRNKNRMQNKINELQQTHKVQFAIWSNILNNNFVPLCRYKQLQQQLVKQQSINFGISTKIVQNNQNIRKNGKQINQFTELGSKNTQLGNLFNIAYQKCFQDLSPQNIQCIFNGLKYKICRQYQTIYQYCKKTQEQNKKLHKKVQQLSKIQLEFIVKEKDYQKQLNRLVQHISLLTTHSSQKQRQIQGQYQKQKEQIFKKLRDLSHLDQSTNHSQKNNVQKFRDKIMIDSVRRNMLLSVDRKKLELQLEKEELGIICDLQTHQYQASDQLQTLDTQHT